MTMLDFTPKHDYLVGIDSDGCAFDTMELKHKECFIPNTINHWELAGRQQVRPRGGGVRQPLLEEPGDQSLSGAGRDAGVAATSGRRSRRGVRIDIPQSLRDWIKRETKLGNPALEKAAAETGDPDLQRTLRWSKAINQSSRRWSAACRRFLSSARACKSSSRRADILVVSATPQAALQREWDEHDLSRYVVAICGQEIGTKKECLGAAAKYPPGRALMIGDAPGDYQAAVANRALFFPINPGAEEASWKRFHRRGDRAVSLPARWPATTSGSCSTSSRVISRSGRRGRGCGRGKVEEWKGEG